MDTWVLWNLTGEHLTDVTNASRTLLMDVETLDWHEPSLELVLEGSIAVTGALIQWRRDRLKIIESAPEVEELARTVDDNGGVYFVPAFSGLFAPYWRDDARAVIVGLTAYAHRGHIARAALEAAAWQSREVVDAANAVAGVPFTELRERWAEDRRWEPAMDDDERERQYARWKRAVQRSLDWIE
jgi:glycerol kinase